MKIAVMGAGAVGCYYGGMLARGGHDVTLVARPQHVEAIVGSGLRLQTTSFDENVRLAATADAAGVAGADIVLCCVKSTDTPEAADSMAPHLAPDSAILSLQNGVDNADRLAERLERPVAAVVVYVASEMAGPGHVRHHGRGELVIDRQPRSEEIAAHFSAAGIPTTVSDNVRGELWAKLILNCSYNAMSAISRQPYARLAQGVGVEAVMRDAMHECLAVARALGVEVPGDAWEAVQRIARTMPGQYSSTAQDLMRGKRTEIDHINGYVVRQGELLGVPTPVNRTLHALVKLLESA